MIAITSNQKPVLRFGARGQAVQELQQQLNTYGYKLPVDGIFGAWTEGAVRDFQGGRFIRTNGIVDSRTWRALLTGAPVTMPVLRLNGNRDEVVIVQTLLSRLVHQDKPLGVYYTGPVNGRFDLRTEQAVKDFQASSGLAADGIVGRRTWRALSKHRTLLYEVEQLAA